MTAPDLRDQMAMAEPDWIEAADSLCAAVEKRVEATARKAAESLYEALLYDTQDYLRENANYNLKAEVETARGEATRCREALARVAKALGLSVNNYYGVTADEIIAEFERLDALVARLRADAMLAERNRTTKGEDHV